MYSVPQNDEEEDAEPPIRLGTVTAGAFSVARGRFHGVAVVGAGALLRALTAPQSAGSYLTVRRLDGARELQLKVHVRDGDSVCEGALGLLR